ncbi:hypothetical protein BDN72DRAFT_773063 [Pluteus cervinus]|uniref:Uncharacterized protein n=1 Tax=Pluteus cervinus TaxID=181527 RepID=A0ACD3AIB8_9AGAR|nr:hypothetical protein BDN72DRAFT_773063 [Pluteus cervinus]
MSSALAERVQTGFYDSMVAQAKAMGESCLAFADYKTHFFPESDWGSATRYVTAQKKVFHANIFGEICGKEDGTHISAKGNHFVGNAENPNYITDTTRVKDTIVLRAPTDSPPELLRIFDNQLGTLNEVRRSDIEKESDDFRQYIVKEWIKSTSPGEMGSLICVTCPPRYAVSCFRSTRRGYGWLMEFLGRGRYFDLVSIWTCRKARFGWNDEVRLGAYYDPAVLPDYRGNLFKHRRAKLLQHDVRDEEGNLIPPWEIYSALRPGTIVLIMVTLHCYVMGGDNMRKRKVRDISLKSAFPLY